jgi:non-heme chloroperoxidase
VDSENPERGPLLLIAGDKDHTIPPALVKAAFNKQRRNEGVTELQQVADRGHALTIDGGWREVAGKALAFIKRFA